MQILLICDLPPSSGVGRYTSSIFLEMRKNSVHADLLWLYSKTITTLFSPLRRHALMPILHEILNAIWKYWHTHLASIKLNNYTTYHLTNPSISILSKRLRPSIITVHDLISFLPQVRGSPTDTLLRLGMRDIKHANLIICVSESTKNDLLRFINIDPRKLKVVYYGVDHDLFKPRDKLEAKRRLRLPLDKPIILNVGSEEPRKNVPTLLKAFKKLLSDIPNALLVRVGERTAGVERLVRALELSDKVLYRRASPSEVAFYYNAADLLVHTSYYEGFGNPPLEAMSSGCPVIAGNRTSIPEVVGDAGILLGPFDVEGFAYWMREVLTNEDLRFKLSQKGLERSMNFSWEKCARETLEVYREVLNEV
ncbi:MAG: glycosyltransferase family 1 protein [Thermoprotei archaeon]